MPITMYSGGQPWGGMPQNTPREDWDYRFRAMNMQRQAQQDAAATQAKILADLERERIAAGKESEANKYGFLKGESAADRTQRLAELDKDYANRAEDRKSRAAELARLHPSWSEQIAQLSGLGQSTSAPAAPSAVGSGGAVMGAGGQEVPIALPSGGSAPPTSGRRWTVRNGQLTEVDPEAEAFERTRAQQLVDLQMQGLRQGMTERGEDRSEVLRQREEERKKTQRTEMLAGMDRVTANMTNVKSLADKLGTMTKSWFALDATDKQEAGLQAAKLESAGRSLISKMAAAGVDPEITYADIRDTVLSAIPNDDDYAFSQEAANRVLVALQKFAARAKASGQAVASVGAPAAPATPGGLTAAMVSR